MCKNAAAPESLRRAVPVIVLINGVALAKRTTSPNLAVSVSHAYEVKRIGTDWFGEG